MHHKDSQLYNYGFILITHLKHVFSLRICIISVIILLQGYAGQLASAFIFKRPLLFSYLGSKRSETASESRPVATAWSGGFLSGSKRRAPGGPEPLWRPVSEEEEDVQGSSSEVSVSKPSQGDTPPASPRTMKAIQAAMKDSSDEEEEGGRVKNQGGLSPRTLLAIQQALAEEEDSPAEQGRLISSLPPKQQVNIHQVVISSSEEEPEPDNVNSVSNEKSDLKRNPTGQSSHEKDSLVVSSSEDETEEVIGQRNKALCVAQLKQPHERETESEQEKGQMMENTSTGSRRQTEEPEEPETRAALITRAEDLVRPQGATGVSQDGLPIGVSVQICGNPPMVLEPTINTDVPEERINVKSEGSEESESEGTAPFSSQST